MQIIGKHQKSILFTVVLLLILSACSSPQAWVWVEGETDPVQVSVKGETVQDVLKSAGLATTENDRVYLDGMTVDAALPQKLSDGAQIHIRRAVEISLDDNGEQLEFRSSASTLGEALWEQSIFLSISDFVSPQLESPLEQGMQVVIRRSKPVVISVDGQEILAPTAAQTVGEALASAGVSLQNLDYSIPAEQEALPAEGVIKVVRVLEEVILEQEAVPFENEYIADGELELDQTQILSAGEYGLNIARVRVRYEDGQEVSRKTETQWLVKAPITQKTAYGTKINIRSMNTPSGPIEYWRAISVYITSYHETGQTTSSGEWPVKGDIAVKLDWYRLIKGQRLYVPDYGIGVVSDVCPGCVGKPWIDVFLPDEEYVHWYFTKTIYFLTPLPANIPYILP